MRMARTSYEIPYEIKLNLVVVIYANQRFWKHFWHLVLFVFCQMHYDVRRGAMVDFPGKYIPCNMLLLRVITFVIVPSCRCLLSLCLQMCADDSWWTGIPENEVLRSLVFNISLPVVMRWSLD